MSDPINPDHYKIGDARCPECDYPIECIDITRHLHFNVGNAIKYLWRFRDKGGVEDLKKARWYLDDQIKLLEGKTHTDI